MRRTDWVARLDHFLINRRDMPFAFGTNDCVLFAWGALAAICEQAPALPAEPWSNEFEANSRIQDGGGSIFLAMNFAQEIMPNEASTGDIAGLIIDGRESLGVVLNETIAGPGESGLSRHPRTDALRAWRIS